MNRLATLLIALCAALWAAAADSLPYLEIRDTSGCAHTLAADGLRFTIADGALTATNAQATITFALDELATMAFVSSPSGIEDAATAAEDPVSLYTPAGVHAGDFPSLSAASAAAPGVYIVKTSSSTFKISISK